MVELNGAFHVDLARRTATKHRLQTMTEEISSRKENETKEHVCIDDCGVDGKHDATMTNKIDFVLKLCQAQLAFGQCTVDAEERTTNAAIALGLPSPTLDIGPRCMNFAFEGIKSGILGRSHDIVLCKLQDIDELTNLVATEGQNFTDDDVKAAEALLEEIINEPLPYGWLIQDFFFVSLAALAAVGAFFGEHSISALYCYWRPSLTACVHNYLSEKGHFLTCWWYSSYHYLLFASKRHQRGSH